MRTGIKSAVQKMVEIPGTLLHAFIHNGWYILAEIKVYQDGMIDCWDLVNFEGFQTESCRRVGCNHIAEQRTGFGFTSLHASPPTEYRRGGKKRRRIYQRSG